MKIPGLSISESEYLLENEEIGKLTVFIYCESSNPSSILDTAIREYVGNNKYHELMDASLSNPWMRVIVSNINDMYQEEFDTRRHSLLDRSMIRQNKINIVTN